MKTYRPIVLVFLFAAIGVAIFAWSSYRNTQFTLETQNWINHTNEIIKHLDDLQSVITAEESEVRGYAISGNKAFVENLNNQTKRIEDDISRISSLTKDNGSQSARINTLRHYVEAKLAFQKTIIEARKFSADSAQTMISTMQGKNLMDELSVVLSNMRAEENDLLQSRIKSNQQFANKSFYTTLYGAAIVLIFVAVLLYRLNRDIFLRRKAEETMKQSETRYRAFVENAEFVTFTADAEGKFTFISKQVEQLTGFTAPELLRRHFTFLIQPGWVDKVAALYADQVIKNERETNYVFPIRHKNGGQRWVEQDAILLQEEGVVTGFQCVVRDVTEKTLIRQELARAEEEKKEYQYRVQAILDNAPLIIYVKDLEGKYVLANKQFKDIFNLADEEVIGKTSFDITGEASSKYTEADKRVISTLKPVEMEDVLSRPDGDLHLLTIKFPLFDKDNKLFGVSGFMKDISEIVKNREELVASRKKAESAEMLQEQFLANMSHEIRTPMNGIIGMTNLLMKTPMQKEQEEYVQVIKQSSDNLLVLINDILDLSKIKAGKISIEHIDFNLHRTLDQLTRMFSAKASEKKIDFVVDLPSQIPAWLNGDPYRLTQILNNLISNAIKFTEKGKVHLSVELQETSEEKAWINFIVTDSGIGIDQKQLSLIFESFAQGANDTTRKFGGTGLGLAITKKLTEMQGGTITVTSSPNIGSTFVVNLPFAIVDAPDSIHHEAGASAEKAVPVFEGKRVLIVEDNEINQKVLAYNLIQRGIEATVTTNGKEAVQLLSRDAAFDLILMDLRMPEMDGYQATDYIRRKLKLSLPIVILTASALRNERQKCFDMGANDYVTKPFSPAQLDQCLGQYLLHDASYVFAKNAESVVNTTAEYDIAALLELEDADSIKMVYELFESSLPNGLEELKQSVLGEQWPAVYEQAHKLKSSLGVIRVPFIHDRLAKIEQLAKNREALKTILPMIHEAVNRLQHVLPMIKLEVENETTVL